jgi:endonuclease YncB( thermonuclease family)
MGILTSGMSGAFIHLAAAAALALVQGQPHVTDGDTIRIGETRIRLEGIDAPEMSQQCTKADGSDWKCGEAAKAALIQKIGNEAVRCEISGTDRYGRSLGTCWSGTINLNQWLVGSGWAVAYRRYSFRYVTDEQVARGQRLNIWNGGFEPPTDYRAAVRRGR